MWRLNTTMVAACGAPSSDSGACIDEVQLLASGTGRHANWWPGGPSDDPCPTCGEADCAPEGTRRSLVEIWQESEPLEYNYPGMVLRQRMGPGLETSQRVGPNA